MHDYSGRIALALAMLAAPVPQAFAKPIAYADGTTVMLEYGAGTMAEAQVFHAPSYRYSFGGGHLSLDSEAGGGTQDFSYLRFNYLPKRWNLESAQANVFVWASAGNAHIGETGGDRFAWNVGGQFDYETRRVYASLRTDQYESSAFSQRIDTLQLRFAPYAHDYDRLAVWFVAQARHADELSGDVELAALLRLFKRNAWIEAGLTQDGKLQAMLMFNF